MANEEMINNGLLDSKKSFEFITQEILKNFKFEKVHTAMIAVGWEWFLGHTSDGLENYGIPSLNTIRNHAYKLLKSTYEDGNQHASGGFIAGWDSGEIYLVFNLEEHSV